jgi:hypothetical protein
MKALCKIRGLFYFVKPVRFMQGIKLKKLLQQQILLGLYSGKNLTGLLQIIISQLPHLPLLTTPYF